MNDLFQYYATVKGLLKTKANSIIAPYFDVDNLSDYVYNHDN